MTSKKALENMIRFHDEEVHDVGSTSIENDFEEAFDEEIAIIKNDLEVLEILKETLSIDDQSLGGFPHTEICVFRSMEDFEKVKAWLERK